MREGLTDGGRGAAGTLWRRFGANLVVLELAIAVVLAGGRGAAGEELLQAAACGVWVSARSSGDCCRSCCRRPPTPKIPQVVAVSRQILRALRALPGVKSAGLTSVLPVSGNGNTNWIRIVGKPYNGEHNEVNQREVSSDYFKTLQAKLIAGTILYRG